MNPLGFTSEDKRVWGLAAGVALCAHGAVAGFALFWSRPAVPPVPEPVILVELPPEGAPAPAFAEQQDVTPPQPENLRQDVVTPPIDIPPVRAPLPKDAVLLPPPAPLMPVRQSAPSPAPAPAPPLTSNVPTPALAGTAATTNPTPGSDPRAKRAEADYFSLISAHLNRRKVYPTEAKKARQQGVVTVRFTVDRAGNVSNISIRRTSGHDILDAATLALVQRVAPLPKMPASMQRDSVTLALPIDYSLKTD